MTEQRVTSIAELVEAVGKAVGKRTCPTQRVLWFRGHRSANWNVEAKIWRGYDKNKERNFTNRFRARASTRLQSAPNYDDCAYWLSLMQHYGLPTRLLDWTRSPLIAAYFALEKHIYESGVQLQDAAIWILEPHKLNDAEEMGDVTPSIDAHMCEQMLVPAFSHNDLENNKILAVMTAERDTRMFIQQSCFTIHSDQRPLNARPDHQNYLTKLIIPAQHIKEMAFDIDICGFRKGDIFPDLGHLAAELEAIYPPT